MRRLALGLSAVLVLGACQTLTTGTDFDRSADFSAYKTYAWLPRPHRRVDNPLNVRRVQEAIQAELDAKGYTQVSDPAAASLAIDYTIGSRERLDVTTYPADFRGPWFWGGPYFGNTVDVRQYQEGTLSIDFFDAHTHQPVWHGWAKKPLSTEDLANPGPGIRTAVAAVLKGFPPGSGPK